MRYSKIRPSELRKKFKIGEGQIFDQKPENEEETVILHELDRDKLY